MTDDCNSEIVLRGELKQGCCCCEHGATFEYILEGSGAQIVGDLVSNKQALLQMGYEVWDWHLDQLSTEGCDTWLQVIEVRWCGDKPAEDPPNCLQ